MSKALTAVTHDRFLKLTLSGIILCGVAIIALLVTAGIVLI
jgi:hypothetical protein